MKLLYTDVASWPEAAEEAAARLVSASRFARADRARTRADARGILAAGLLLRYVFGCTDENLKRDARGKPYLPGGMQLNLTHGGTLAAIIAADTPCGVDAEPLHRRILSPERLFLPQELASGAPLAALWTRKEALWKADGRGVVLAKQPISVLQDAAALDGETYQLRTFLRAGHALSASAQEPICEAVCLEFGELI